MRFETSTARGDCCTPALPWGALPIPGTLARALAVTSADGLRVHYVTRGDLIRMRRAAGRPKDLRRAAELERLGAAAPGL